VNWHHPLFMLHYRKLILAIIVILSGITFFSACRSPLPKEEAEKHLKAFDNEMIILLRSLKRTGSFKILQEILSVENVPVPFFAHESEIPGGTSKFNFEELCGLYLFDSAEGEFIRHSKADSVIIFYPIGGNPKRTAQLVIAAYSEDASSSSLMVPTVIKAYLLVGDRIMANIDHYARVEYRIPVEVHTSIEVANYFLKIDLSSRMRRTYSNANLMADIYIDDELKASASLHSKIGFADDGEFFMRSLRMEASAFPVMINARIDNDAIDSRTKDFIEEFNRHSKIEVFKLNDKRKLGSVKLKAKDSSDKLDYAFYYGDGSFIFLEELLLTVREILNIKK
jgi:hypothetical protein